MSSMLEAQFSAIWESDETIPKLYFFTSTALEEVISVNLLSNCAL